MVVRLLVTNSKANVKKVVLRGDTVIGRSSDCNLRIASQEVSRQHCSILVTENQVRLRDLGSANGTYLNGERIKAHIDVPLPTGSELEVGNVRFVVEHDAPLPSGEPDSTAEVPNAAVAAAVSRKTDREQDPPVAAPVEDEWRGEPQLPVDAEDRDDRSSEDATMRVEASAPADDPSPSQFLGSLAASDSDESPAESRSSDSTIDERLAVDEAEAADTVDFFPSTGPPPTAQPAADEPAAPEDVPAPPPTPEKDQSSKEGRWKSMFGLLGRKENAAATSDVADAVPVGEADDALDGDTVLDETIYEGLAPQPEDVDDEPATDLHVDVPEADDALPDEPASEEHLQQFFKQLSQE